MYCNPPYGEVRDRWVKRCIAAARDGSRVVLLMPSATDTRTFQLAFAHCTNAIFIGGRLKFQLARENGRQRAASHGSTLYGFGVNLRRARSGSARAPCRPPSLPPSGLARRGGRVYAQGERRPTG